MKNLLQLLEENTKKFPQKTALSFRNGDEIEILTWKKFWAMVCQTANGLHTLDVKKGDCVGVFSQNSKDWIIFDVAVQMLGAITIPIYATNNYDQTEYARSKLLYLEEENQTPNESQTGEMEP